MKCHYVTHHGERIFIPWCWGSVIWDKSHCTCKPEASLTDRVKRLEMKVNQLEIKIAQMENKDEKDTKA